MLECGQPRLGDSQRDPAAGIARARQRQPFLKRHRVAIQLQMRAGIILEKSDDELRAIGAAIVLELGLRGYLRRTGHGSDEQQCTGKDHAL